MAEPGALEWLAPAAAEPKSSLAPALPAAWRGQPRFRLFSLRVIHRHGS